MSKLEIKKKNYQKDARKMPIESEKSLVKMLIIRALEVSK